MISRLDHVLLVCQSIDEGEEIYSRLLGREPDWRHADAGGAGSVMFQLENMALELMAPTGGGPVARRLHNMIDQDGQGLKSLIFGTDDIALSHAVLQRRGMRPDEPAEAESVDPYSGRVRTWTRFRLDDAGTFGVRMFVLQRRASDPLVCRAAGPGAVSALDHVVVNTPQPDRAAALYGARLGLRLALDRSNPDWDMRLQFFRTGDLTVELAHKLSSGVSEKPDKLWGLSWRVPDIEAAHARMTGAGLSVSAIRQGRKAGTRVFSVRDGAINTPTLILAHETAGAG